MNQEINLSLLNMIEHPAFCVQNNTVIHANVAAQELLILEGMPIASLLKQDLSAYQEYCGGHLYLHIQVSGTTRSATVTRLEDLDLFLVQDEDQKLQAFALAAKQLRIPFNDVMLAVDCMTAERALQGDAANSLYRGLNQMHRILCNMSDTGRYRHGADAQLEPTDLTAFFAELMEKLTQIVLLSGCTLDYTGPAAPFIALADRVMLERAVSNLLTNAIKFSPAGSVLTAQLVSSGDQVRFSLQDSCPRDTNAMQNPFTRYLRAVTLEDSRSGLGLGLPLVASIAAIHNGTTLVDYPGDQGTRVSFTIRQFGMGDSTVRSPIRVPRCDYAGGRDRSLLEFSEVLPASAYQKSK